MRVATALPGLAGAADGAAKLVQDIFGEVAAVIEVVAGAHGAVGVELVEGAVELVGAAFDGDVHGGSAGHALLSVEAVGDDVDGFDGVLRGDVGDDVGEPGVTHRGAVDAGVVVVAVGAVDVGGQGAGGRFSYSHCISMWPTIN